jgi:hypothetical protein
VDPTVDVAATAGPPAPAGVDGTGPAALQTGAGEGDRPPEKRPGSSNGAKRALAEWVVIVVVALVAALLV